MLILLHKLAHKVMPKGFAHDRLTDPPGASDKNTQLVYDKCRYAIEFEGFLTNQK